YDGWLALFRSFGWEVSVLEAPHVGKTGTRTHQSFLAKVEAASGILRVKLEFDRGTATTASAPGTLAVISIRVTETSPAAAGSDDGSADPGSGDALTMLFPLFGVTLGTTTVKELGRLGKRTSTIDDSTGEPYECYEINGL